MRLQAELARYADLVKTGDLEFDFKGSGRSVAMMMFSMFSMMASVERDWLTSRMFAGRLAKWRRGEWPYGQNMIPFGYELDAQHQLVPIPELQPAVREMLIILSNRDMAPSEMVSQLGVIGMTSMRKHRRLGDRIPASAIASPHAFVKGLYAWASVWVLGEYLWRVHNHVTDLDEFCGAPISRYPHSDENGDPDRGELHMLYRVGTPEDGWAEPEILDAFTNAAYDFMATRTSSGTTTPQRPLAPAVGAASAGPDLHRFILSPNAARGSDNLGVQRRNAARAKKEISPFSGRHWEDDGWHVELQVTKKNMYQLIRWPIETEEAAS